jgi:hypothetical protein
MCLSTMVPSCSGAASSATIRSEPQHSSQVSPCRITASGPNMTVLISATVKIVGVRPDPVPFLEYNGSV